MRLYNLTFLNTAKLQYNEVSRETKNNNVAWGVTFPHQFHKKKKNRLN